MKKFQSVLLVDDDKATLYLHTYLLKDWRVAEHIYTASNGKEALDFLQTHPTAQKTPPELILLDINMPVMNGYEFLEAYGRLYPSLQPSNILFMLSTHLPSAEKQKALNYQGLNGFLNKPLDKEQLMDLLATLSTEDDVIT